VKILGVTASRVGLTARQLAVASNFLVGHAELHHGDCIGGDADIHHLVRQIAPSTKIVIHPPTEDKNRANCEGDAIEEPLPYRERNQAIVDACEFLIGFPHTMVEIRRSGTWMTIRMARASKTPGVIILPDGTMTPLTSKKPCD
jgi:hypothetical protein